MALQRAAALQKDVVLLRPGPVETVLTAPGFKRRCPCASKGYDQ